MAVINVLYPFDENYVAYAGVSVTSLLESNRGAESINVYILGFGLSETSKDKLRNTVERYGRSIVFIDPHEISEYIDRLEMPSYRGASVAAARLFISDYIDNNVDRIVYLDSDTLIVGDMSGLVQEDMGGCPVAMVEDSVARQYKTMLGFDIRDDYFNAGMILYDLGKWRECRCTQRILDHIKNVRKNYEALDQDLINIVLKGEIHKLDLRYNLQPFHAVYDAKTYLNVLGRVGYYSEDNVTSASKSPVILHCFRYLGMFPWHKDSLHPWKARYEQYKMISDWADTPEAIDAAEGFVFSVEKLLYRILPSGLFLRLFMFVYNMTMKRKNKRRLQNVSVSNI